VGVYQELRIVQDFCLDFQADKSACDSFMNADKRQNVVVRSKDFVTHSKATEYQCLFPKPQLLLEKEKKGQLTSVHETYCGVREES
jgi:hypothetical protein